MHAGMRTTEKVSWGGVAFVSLLISLVAACFMPAVAHADAPSITNDRTKATYTDIATAAAEAQSGDTIFKNKKMRPPPNGLRRRPAINQSSLYISNRQGLWESPYSKDGSHSTMPLFRNGLESGASALTIRNRASPSAAFQTMVRKRTPGRTGDVKRHLKRVIASGCPGNSRAIA